MTPLVRHYRDGSLHITDPAILAMREQAAEQRRKGWETRRAIEREAARPNVIAIRKWLGMDNG